MLQGYLKVGRGALHWLRQNAILLPSPVILQPAQSVTPERLDTVLTPADHGRSYASGLANRAPAGAAPTAAGIRIASPDGEARSIAF